MNFRRGQSIVEVLVAIAVAAIFMVGAVAVIAPSLKISKQTTLIQSKSQLATELFKNVGLLAVSNWSGLFSLATGSANLYYVNTSSSPFTIATGTQLVTISGVSTTRYFYLSDVYRDSNGFVTSSIATYDPSTKKITVVCNGTASGAATTTLVGYVARNNSNVFDQTDWSGGPGFTTSTQVVVSKFSVATNTDYSSIPGSIQGSPPFVLVNTFGSPGTSTGQFLSPEGLAIDTSGSMYIVDNANSRVQILNASGTPIRAFGTNGSGTNQFNSPTGIALDASRNIYVTDSGNNRVEKFSSSGTYLAQIGTSTLTNPYGISFDPSGNMYVTNGSRFSIFSATGTFINQFGSYGSSTGQFEGPFGIAINGSGTIYIADGYVNRVVIYNASGTQINQFGSYGSSSAQFSYPQGVAIDASGSVYVVDDNNFRVEKFNATGTFVTQINNAAFYSLSNVAIDSNGYVYVVNTGGDTIMKFLPATSTTDTLDSPTFDTGVVGGAQFNSIGWQGSQVIGSTVQFQLAVSNSSSGPWSYQGPDATSNTWYTPTGPGVPIPFVYTMFNGNRYVRYRVSIGLIGGVSSRIDDIIINWSP